ncbi:hypothetical protein [Streptomyces sp. NBC_01217]|uniref:hypothetical protein n=1 Tax=Streptomyces sp. NBC_01217 TaxID=2903779 RepID=UPI002E1463DC|nr:hypothetical protein OG507_35880 [Streptomyces sp. NBC_01217]
MLARYETLTRPAIVAALLLGLAGCAFAQPAGRGDEPADNKPALGAAAVALLTKDDPYYADQQILQAAELKLSDRCMKQQGFRDPAVDEPAQIDRDEDWRPDLQQRRIRGYRLGEADDKSASERSADAYLRTLPARQRDRFHWALAGGPTDRAPLTLSSGQTFTFPTAGCIAESRGRLYGSPTTAARIEFIPQGHYVGLYFKAIEDTRYRRAIETWGGCMRGRGYPFATQAQARAQAAAAHKSSRQTAAAKQEIAIAVADAQCVGTAGLTRTVQGLLRGYARELPAAQAKELEELAAMRTDAVQRAENLVN